MTKTLLTRAFRNVVPVIPSRSSNALNTILGLGDSSRTVEMEAVSQVPTLFSIVDRISTSVSAVDWHLYRVTNSGKRTEVTAHPALSVWNKPNQFYSQADFVEASMQHFDLTGEMWWLIDRGKLTVPLELWPIRPDRMKPVPHKTNFIAGYVYKGDQEVNLNLEDVIFTKRQNPIDPYRGLSPVTSLFYDIKAEAEAARFNAMFFKNNAVPGGVIEVEESLSDAEFDDLQRHWNENHQGTANAHRVAILERGKFHEIRYTNRDMEFIGLRQFSKEQIRQAYGFPKFMLGEVSDVNRANAEASEVLFSRWVINPRLDKIKEALNTKFLPMFGQIAKGLEFDYDSPEPENKEDIRAERDSAINGAVQLINAGFDPVAVMEALGLPEIPHIGKVNSDPQQVTNSELP